MLYLAPSELRGLVHSRTQSKTAAASRSSSYLLQLAFWEL